MPISKIKTSSILADAASTNLNIDAGTLFLDATNNNVGIGNTSPASYNASSDNLVIGTSGSNGMTIVSGSTSSGYIMFADGTTGQQAYEGQITYDHTNNFMAFNTTAAERMRIDSSGNVGIGVTAPASRLHVNHPTGSTNAIAQFTNGTTGSAAGNGLYVGIDSSNDATAFNFYNSPMKFGTNGTERMRITSGGNVCIGNTTGGAFLDVGPTTSPSIAALILRGGAGLGNTGGLALYTMDTANATARNWGVVSNSSAYGDFSIRQGTSLGASPFSAGVDRFYINASGNVGIGTSSPNTPLQVNGTIKSYDSGVSNSNLILRNSTTGDAAGFVLQQDGVNTYIYNNSNGFMAFATNGSERMRVSSTGYVGINTSTPGTNGAFEIRRGVTTSSMTNCSFSTSDAANSTFDIGHPASNVVALSGQGSNLAFYGGGLIANAERMRIERTAGNVLINTTGNIFGARLAVVGAYPQVAGSFETNNSTYAAISCYASQGNYPADQISFYSNVSSTATLVGKITSTTNSVSYGSGSDYRLKNTITPMTGALAKVAQLKPVTFKWNVDESDGQGFIAHELQTVIPSAVSGEKDETDENGKPRYQTVDTSFLVATLTAAMQEQQALITQLTERIAALENK
jgi:hypothetical protein